MPLWVSLRVEEEIRKSENTVNDTVSDLKGSKSNAKSLWESSVRVQLPTDVRGSEYLMKKKLYSTGIFARLR